MNWKKRYQQAYYDFKIRNHKEVYELSGCYKTKIPDVKNANGLRKMIVNYINWGIIGNVTPVQTQGRFIQDKNSQGHKIEGSGKWIKGTTQKGTADIVGSLNGIPLNIEIKIGRDKPSEFQLKMQERKRLVKDVYEFISTPEEFFLLYDKIINL